MNTNQQLIRALQSNNRDKMESAFASIYNEYQKLLFYIVIRIVKRQEVAEDIVNDVFLAFFNNVNNLDETRNLKYYLVTAAKNAGINYITRSKAKSAELNEEAVYQVADESSQIGAWQEMVNDFKGIISEDDIDIIIKHLVFNWAFIDIANERGVTVDVVSGKYRRSIKKLKKYYRKEE